MLLCMVYGTQQAHHCVGKKQVKYIITLPKKLSNPFSSSFNSFATWDPYMSKVSHGKLLQ